MKIHFFVKLTSNKEIKFYLTDFPWNFISMSSIWRNYAFTKIVAIWRIFRQIVYVATKESICNSFWRKNLLFKVEGFHRVSKTIQNFPNLQFGYTEKKPVLLAATIKIVPLPRKRNQLLLLSKGGGSGSVGFFHGIKKMDTSKFLSSIS